MTWKGTGSEGGMIAKSDGMKWRDLTPLMQPRSVAVIGASQREARGNGVIRNLARFGFQGRTFPINPKYNEVLGLPCYPDISATPEPADCVVVAIPALQVPDLLKRAVDAGVKAAVVLSSGFGEAGPEGKARQEQLESLSSERGLLICGPNCWGVLNMHGRAAVFSLPLQNVLPSGDVALVSQSGGLSLAIANPLMEHRGVGFSYLVSCGNQAGVTVEEYINYFVEDERTRVIAAFVEGFKEPEKLLAVAKKAQDRGKPIIILKAGRSEIGRRATMAHSGSLAGSAEVTEAVFRRSGIVQVHGLNEMIETINLFSSPFIQGRFSGGRRLAMLGGTGGECSVFADTAEAMGLALPDLAEETKARLREVMPDFGVAGNPLDGTGAMFEDQKLFPSLLQGLVADPNIDLIAVHVAAMESKFTARMNDRRFAGEIVRISADSTKPIFAFSPIVGGSPDPEIVRPLRAAGIPFLEGTEFTLAASRNLVCYHAFRQTEHSQRSALERGPMPSYPAPLPAGVLATPNAFQLLEAFGLPVVPSALAQNVEEAVSAAGRIGYPVALKVESPAIQHKKDVGGVILSLSTPEDVRSAFSRIHKDVAEKAPDAEIRGILVQSMAGQGVELILGIKRDPVFGPALICGLGGIFVEILRDVSIGLPPLSGEGALELLSRLKGWPILKGARGAPPADISALAEAIVSLSRLALALTDRIVALDINPLIVAPEGKGVFAVDALVQLR